MEILLKNKNIFIDFILNQWLVVVSGVGLVLTSLYTKHFPTYSIQELQILFILFILFIAVNGLNNSGLILRIAQKIEQGKAIPLKLVIITFILSIVVTNDIALIIIVPLTISLNINRKGILVIFEALAANAGSALTPFGNPQNLFIYWFYNIHPIRFIESIAPFSLSIIAILIALSLFIKISNNNQETIAKKINKKYCYIFIGLLCIVFSIIIHALPVKAGIIVIVIALVIDRKAFHIDYALLFSFFFFFGIADNLKTILVSEISHSGHVFIFSALASQVMSNVPTTLLFAKFTTNWEALLWGTNAGGFGSLFGSLANLIAYKIYITNTEEKNPIQFTIQFLILGYLAFFISIGLYFMSHPLQGKL